MATKELIDEVYDIVNDRNKAIRIIYTAKSAVRHNLGGNVMRVHGKPEIRLDNEWQKKLAKRQVMAINVITAPARYMSIHY